MASMKALVPLLAMVPKLLISSFLVMPYHGRGEPRGGYPKLRGGAYKYPDLSRVQGI